MAIINCPECGKEISDKAEKCIYCGKVFEENIEPIQNEVDPPHFVWPYFCLRAGFSTQ